MAVAAGIMVPHPPLIVPDVGRGQEILIKDTIKAYQEAAGMAAELKPVSVNFFGSAPFIFHRNGQPLSFPAENGYSLGGGVEFYHIALPAYPQHSGNNRQFPAYQKVFAFFRKVGVMRFLMKKMSFRSPQIFLPLHFNINQRPLPAAKGKMLKTR